MTSPRPENAQRTARRIALTFLGTDAEMEAMHEVLEVLVCGSERHNGACVVPWSLSSAAVELSKRSDAKSSTT